MCMIKWKALQLNLIELMCYYFIAEVKSIWKYLEILSIVWAQNINIVDWSFFRRELYQWWVWKTSYFIQANFFSTNIIFTFGDKITLENILFINKLINKLPSIFYDWVTFSCFAIQEWPSEEANETFTLIGPLYFIFILFFASQGLSKKIEIGSLFLVWN